ncbi:TlyA family RNA methyltransferase [Tsukamurella sp. 1534]|uniref:TlyA family RNA methyltransferase n=1 Tax=Tsukamurella sp. 1534 TaxID=1151061 RepID=UPI0002FDA962|nr:TlyA family RNA methyltransferase [Tsukamurella sp. 1534]
MARRVRLDAELVRRGMARSREHARELIEAGRVTVNKQTARKAANQIDPADPVHVTAVAGEVEWASRGAHKLIGALDAFPEVAVRGRRCLDAGASTGGFTDVLLHRGAERVYAVDVGYGELVWRLRDDPRVTVMDRTNVRTLEPAMLDGPVDLVVGDLSFISLALVLPAIARCTAVGGDVVPMVKPQFEVGKGNVGSGGVVREPELRASAVLGVARAATESGLRMLGVRASPLPGPSGNVEYFLRLRREEGPVTLPDDVDDLIAAAVSEGPQ